MQRGAAQAAFGKLQRAPQPAAFGEQLGEPARTCKRTCQQAGRKRDQQCQAGRDLELGERDVHIEALLVQRREQQREQEQECEHDAEGDTTQHAGHTVVGSGIMTSRSLAPACAGHAGTAWSIDG